MDRKGQSNKMERRSLKRSLVQILNCRGQLHQHKITVLFDFSTDGRTLNLVVIQLWDYFRSVRLNRGKQ